MIPQIPNLKSKYAIWVNKPLDRPLRLFHSNWMEILTKTPWWLIPIFWLPIIFYLSLIGIDKGFQDNFSNVMKLVYFIILIIMNFFFFRNL